MNPRESLYSYSNGDKTITIDLKPWKGTAPSRAWPAESSMPS